MAGSPKFAILEKDGEEFNGVAEYEPEAEDILYEKGKSENVKQVLDKPKKIKKRYTDEVIVDEGYSIILTNPEFENDLVLNGDLVTI